MANPATDPVVVIGAERFPGAYICRHFARLGHEVVAVVGEGDSVPDGMELPWDGVGIGPWAMALEGAMAVIELVDTTSGGRSTELIGRAMAECRVPPAAWLHLGSTGIYQEGTLEPADEWRGEGGEGGAALSARQSEGAFFGSMVPGRVRKLALRVAPVLANDGRSPWDTLVRLARVGVGARRGGRSRGSWLHLDDLLAVLDWQLHDGCLDGWLNVCAPSGARPGEVMRVVREMTGQRFGLPLPRRLWRFIGRRLSRPEVSCIAPVWAQPSRLLCDGFSFRWPLLAPAMRNLIGRDGLDGFFDTTEALAGPVSGHWRPTAGAVVHAPGGCLGRGTV